jgi:uncharacterized membrane protein
MKMQRRFLVLACVISLTVVPQITFAAAMGQVKMDPETRRVRTYYLGDSDTLTWRHLADDPFLEITPVPAAIGLFPMEYIRRHMRLYLPRNLRDYVMSVDLLILSDSDRSVFTANQQMWFKEGVLESGQGLIMAGGFESFGGSGWGNTWKGSSVEDVLPVWCLNFQAWDLNPFLARPAVDASENPFITSLEWDTMPPFQGMNKVDPKIGSVTLLEARGLGLKVNGEPVLVYWETGEGAVLGHMPDWTPAWGTEVYENWKYYPDYMVNMAYLVSGIPVPQDLELVHFVRTELASYTAQRGVAISMLEFGDKFGANVMSLEETLGDIEGMKSEADQYYLDQNYDDALRVMADISEEFERISSEAIKLKNQALFWVYVVEYLAVSGTSLACGFALWTLMVRRRVYREVKTTKLRPG